MPIKKYFDTFQERKEYEQTIKATILNYGIEYIHNVKKYYLLIEY